MKKQLILVLLTFFMLGFLVNSASATGSCETQSPILLVHGIAMRDSTAGIQYFGRVQKFLEDRGAEVYLGAQQAWGSSGSNACQLSKRIASLVWQGKGPKFNIIAHSKGGIDVRKMIVEYPWTKNHIQSLTTLATPHKGSVLADWVYWTPEFVLSAISKVINIVGWMQGDPDANSYEAGNDLTSSVTNEFNNSSGHLDSETRWGAIPGISCQSYTATMRNLNIDAMLWTSSSLMCIAGHSPNDGAVSKASGKFGWYRGEVEGSVWLGGVSHFQITDRSTAITVGGTPGFDARYFYNDLVSELKSWNY